MTTTARCRASSNASSAPSRRAATSATASCGSVTGDRPPGRRYAWSALSPDETLVVFGYGSDSPMGQSVLDDLWTFDLTTGVWAPLEPEGERPSARGFGPNWQLPDSAAADWPDLVGLLGFGSTATMQVTRRLRPRAADAPRRSLALTPPGDRGGSFASLVAPVARPCVPPRGSAWPRLRPERAYGGALE